MTSVFKLATATLEPGVTLIEASAGTGKTFSLAGLILRLILEEHLPISEILAVTYTVAATKELKDRVRQRLHEALGDLRRGETEDEIVRRFLKTGDVAAGARGLDLALQSFDEAQVFTIHGFCQRVLHDHAFESGMSFDADLVTDATPLFEQVARDFWRLKFQAAAPLIPALMLAWQQSPQSWVKLLDQTRNHPDLVLIPPALPKLFDQLEMEIRQAFENVCAEWRSNQLGIQKLLEHDSGLSRNQTAFPPERVVQLIAGITEACDDFERADPISIKTLSEVTTEAIAARTKKKSTPPTHRFFELCTIFTDLVEDLFTQLTYDFLAYAKAELPLRKARANVVTFDDLILRLRDALVGPSGDSLASAVGTKYKAALIDEFQDTDPAQYEIFQRIFATGKHRLYYIGDPKQAIYGFRGADVFTYLTASAQADRRFTLGTNWRSESGLVAAVNDLFQQSENAFVLPGIEYRAVKPAEKPEATPLTGLAAGEAAPLQFRSVASTKPDGGAMNQREANEAICAMVTGDILKLRAAGARLGDRPIGFGDMAVLVRRHAQAAQMQEALRARGVRSIVQSERSVFASPEAREIQLLLQGVLEPTRERLFRAALATNLIGLNGDQLVALNDDEAARQLWLDRFSEWQTQWLNECFIALFRQVVVQQDVRARIVQLPGGERRLTNFLHLAELLHAAETSERLQPDGLCSWLKRERSSNRVAQDEFQLRLESDADAVQIVTIHKCKGLEYPIVFCPFLWLPAESALRDELQFHDRDHADALTLSLRGKSAGTDKERAWQSEEIMSEEVRMLYVAVTRARNRCTIYSGEIKNIEKSSLARLFGPGADPADAIRNFVEESKGNAAISEADDLVSITDVAPPAETRTFEARAFTGSIDRTAMVTSFSGLNAGRIEVEEREPEVSDEAEQEVPETSTPGDTIFDFARGARAGDFFHAVLENLDFRSTDQLEELVDAQLIYHGLGQTPCRSAVLTKLQELVHAELLPGFRLRDLSGPQRISELEFTYRLGRLDPKRLRNILTKCEDLPSTFTTNLGRLRFDPVEGFMRGFIDLFFQFENRYYVLDWKSNWLGDRPADYDEEGMRDSMREHNYYLQSYLYALAADLFLQSRLNGYSYARDFGGVLYVFLRGIDAQKPGRGVLQQRPTDKTIKALRQLAA
jgi:exodeoxyribonuclease V beta subunit